MRISDWSSDVCSSDLHLIKCNPAIKDASDREALIQALASDVIDVLATDHAPHTWEEKHNPYARAPSGLPLVQYVLVAALEMVREGRLRDRKSKRLNSSH